MKQFGRAFFMALGILVIAASQGFAYYDDYREDPVDMGDALCMISLDSDIEGLLGLVHEDMLIAFVEQMADVYGVDDLEDALSLTMEGMYAAAEEDPTEYCEVTDLVEAECLSDGLDVCAYVTLYEILESGEEQESEIPIFALDGIWYVDIFSM